MADLRLRPSEDPPSFLVLLLDTDLPSWAPSPAPTSPDNAAAAALSALHSATSQIIIFLSTFLLLHPDNRIAVLMHSRAGHAVAYPSLPATPPTDSTAAAARGEQIVFSGGGGGGAAGDDAARDAREAVQAGLRESLEKQTRLPADAPAAPRLAASLAQALCLVNRRRVLHVERARVGKEGAARPAAEDKMGFGRKAGGLARILVVSRSADVPTQYVPVMNGMFAAQRMRVPIDMCYLREGRGSTYFQQAAYWTGGVYFRPPGGEGELLQTLMTVFMTDSAVREVLAMPQSDEVDFRASCFRTRKLIQQGYTCSVCLSTFELDVGKKANSCPTCEARFTGGRV